MTLENRITLLNYEDAACETAIMKIVTPAFRSELFLLADSCTGRLIIILQINDTLAAYVWIIRNKPDLLNSLLVTWWLVLLSCPFTKIRDRQCNHCIIGENKMQGYCRSL